MNIYETWDKQIIYKVNKNFALGDKISIIMKLTTNTFQTIWVYVISTDSATCSNFVGLLGASSITSLGGDSGKELLVYFLVFFSILETTTTDLKSLRFDVGSK